MERMSARTLLTVAIVAGAFVLAHPDAPSLYAGAEPDLTPGQAVDGRVRSLLPNHGVRHFETPFEDRTEFPESDRTEFPEPAASRNFFTSATVRGSESNAGARRDDDV